MIPDFSRADDGPPTNPDTCAHPETVSLSPVHSWCRACWLVEGVRAPGGQHVLLHPGTFDDLVKASMEDPSSAPSLEELILVVSQLQLPESASGKPIKIAGVGVGGVPDRFRGFLPDASDAE